VTSGAWAHESGAPFSGAILDPLVLHHAHIENEQRLNLSAARLAGTGTGPERWAFESELELSWSTNDYMFGAEAFFPLANVHQPGAGRVTGVGDVVVRPFKFSPLMTREVVLSLASEIMLPTGDASSGLGSGNTSLGQFLFIDRALGNWFIGLNTGVTSVVQGEQSIGSEYGIAGSYSFIQETMHGGIAPVVPHQWVVPAVSLEAIASSSLANTGPGRLAVSILPGLGLWWPASGMQLRMGVERDVYQRGGDSEWAFMLQVGNHRRWTQLFSGSSEPPHGSATPEH